ncbi:MAG: GntR family transcriptional regulator [Rhodospirillales bacterium]|nr:GntR family transcriptional regulator [Rhodospirillales bacterium]MDP6774399.1 GntR family transcriptional regulator [Rhodospirillales bacterium]
MPGHSKADNRVRMIMGQLTKTYKRSRVPLYLQVASTLARRIEGGQWQPGQKISTLEELGVEFQVARVTVRQAIEVLQNDGLVRCRQGKGTFVTQGARNKRWLKLETEWSALIETIGDNVPRFIVSKDPAPAPRLEDGEGAPAAGYQHLLSVQSRNNQPYAVASVYLARHVYERAPEQFRAGVALAVLPNLDGLAIASARQTLVIGSADTETAELLKVALNAPTAEARCVVVDDKGVAIYIGDIVYRGDCVKLDIDLLGGGAG